MILGLPKQPFFPFGGGVPRSRGVMMEQFVPPHRKD
jgi:hypothetical protein